MADDTITKRVEPELPNTLTNEGHDLPVRNLFYNLRWYEITKPLVMGFTGTVIIAIMTYTGMLYMKWWMAIAVAAMPLIAAHFYLKLLVEGAPPENQRDLAARLLALEPDYDHPLVSWLPFIPSLRPNLTMCSELELASKRHPLLRLQEKFEKLAHEKALRRGIGRLKKSVKR
jgi:hypothetical protein